MKFSKTLAQKNNKLINQINNRDENKISIKLRERLNSIAINRMLARKSNFKRLNKINHIKFEKNDHSVYSIARYCFSNTGRVVQLLDFDSRFKVNSKQSFRILKLCIKNKSTNYLSY